ncbi:hypothetical protein, partial [Bifidobacterium panos]|uniref:hypothetical protein n=1 Tax=Bifidobacterium panos TaxID=2675321 RepID=UPI001C13258A
STEDTGTIYYRKMTPSVDIDTNSPLGCSSGVSNTATSAADTGIAKQHENQKQNSENERRNPKQTKNNSNSTATQDKPRTIASTPQPKTN